MYHLRRALPPGGALFVYGIHELKKPMDRDRYASSNGINCRRFFDDVAGIPWNVFPIQQSATKIAAVFMHWRCRSMTSYRNYDEPADWSAHVIGAADRQVPGQRAANVVLDGGHGSTETTTPTVDDVIGIFINSVSTSVLRRLHALFDW
jgi:hypothetical protein